MKKQGLAQAVQQQARKLWDNYGSIWPRRVQGNAWARQRRTIGKSKGN